MAEHKKVFTRFTVHLQPTALRKEKLDGIEHWVIPAVMMMEGVWIGNNGPTFYPGPELQKACISWNHKPVVVYHPKDGNEYISAAKPNILNRSRVGLLLNTRWEEEKQKTEVWVNEGKCREVDIRVADAISKLQPVEGSTGLDADGIETAGEYNGKAYGLIAVNHRPDHYALLPDQIGACAVKDGAGLFANTYREPESVRKILERSYYNAIKAIGADLTTNELSFSDISATLSMLLAGKFGQRGRYWDGYIIEVYPDRVIFRDENGDLMSVDYSVSTNDLVSLGSDVRQVKRETVYVDVRNSKKEEEPMLVNNSTVPAFDKKAHIDQMIANNVATEEDRANLMNLSEKMLKQLFSGDRIQTPPPNANPTPGTPASLVAQPVVANASPQTMQDWLKNQPTEVQRWANRMMTNEASRKTELITKIVNHAKSINAPQQPNPAWLAEQPVETLEAMAAIIPTQTVTANAGQEGPPVFVGAAGFHTGFHQQQDGAPSQFFNGFHPSGMNPAPLTVNSRIEEEPLPEPNFDWKKAAYGGNSSITEKK